MKRIALLLIGLTILGVFVGLWKPFVPNSMSKKIYGLENDNEELKKPDQPGEAAAWWASLHKTPNGENPMVLNLEAKKSVSDIRRGAVSSTLLPMKFENIGPGNFGGRIRAMAVHPVNTQQLLIGGVSGGIWKSTDAGTSWAPMSDFMNSLAVSWLLVDPDNNDRVWATTGEGFYNVDAAQGNGLFRSDDFGNTWNQVVSTSGSDFYYSNRVARVAGTNIIVVATRNGLFRSTDLGSSWNEVSGISVSQRGFVDVKADPSDPTRLFAYHYGSNAAKRFLMRSEDSGATWANIQLSSGLPVVGLTRGEIGIGTDGVVYLALSDLSYDSKGLYRSSDHGATFLKTASNTKFVSGQGWYDMMIGVDPSDSDHVYLGGLDVYETTDAGANIQKISSWAVDQQYGVSPDGWVHADIHNLIFQPGNPSQIWVGCDGGIFGSSDGGANWEFLNHGLDIYQVYGMGAHPDGTMAVAGSQDNGTNLFFGDKNVSIRWSAGDGAGSQWDQQDPNYFYGSHPYLSEGSAGFYGTADLGGSTSTIYLPDNTGASFIPIMRIDENDGSRIMVGTDNVFFSNNIRLLGSATFTDVSGSLGSVSAVAFDYSDSTLAYAGAYGNIYKIADLGGTNSLADISDPGFPNQPVTWIESDPHDGTSQTLYATFAGYTSSGVFKTTDGGTSWVSIHANLPNIPFFSIRVDPADPDRLFLGSELGLWSTVGNSSGSYNWEQYDYGTAWTRCMALQFTDDDTLFVATHGRGMFRAKKTNACRVELGTILDQNCDIDGFIDEYEIVQIPVNIFNESGTDFTNASISMASDYLNLSINTPSQSYGTIGAFSSGSKSFEANLNILGACLDTANLTVDISTDQGTFQQVIPVILGANPNPGTGTYTDGAETDGLMTHFATFGIDDWSQVSDQVNSGAKSWFSADMDHHSDNSLVTPWLDVQAGSTLVSFWLYYDMEGDGTQYWDGAVLELRTANGDWQDIGQYSTVSYDGRLWVNSPLYYRPAWSGTQTTWRQAEVDLGSDYNGETIQIRFRVACDSGFANAGGGFWVDDFSITNVNWKNPPVCDDIQCDPTCFVNENIATKAIQISLGNSEWYSVKSVLDYVAMLNNICP